MKRLTRTISILLALLMVLGAFPTLLKTAFAEEAEQPATGDEPVVVTIEEPEEEPAEESEEPAVEPEEEPAEEPIEEPAQVPAELPEEAEQPATKRRPLRSVSTEATDADFDGIPDAIDNDSNSNTFAGSYKSGDFQINLSYTMDYRTFFGDNTVYHEDIAGTSVWAAQFCYEVAESESDRVTYTPLVALPNGEGGTFSKITHVDQFMKAHGMEDVIDYLLKDGCSELGIDPYTDDDITEVFLGHHRVEYNGQTIEVLAVFVRGTNKTTEEWCSNFDVGDLNRYEDEYDCVEGKSPRQSNADWNRKSNHRGFDVCATRIRRAITAYRQTYMASSNAEPVYWLTGHSRGGAVANLLASYYVDEGSKVFAYTFASPNNTANTEAPASKYDCIYNLVNADDFVPMLPMPEWGFTRYGRTARVSAPAKNSTDRNSILGTGGYSCATQSELSELAGKFVNMTINNAGNNEGWRDVYVYHCKQDSGSTAQYHNHTGETIGEYRDGSWKSFFTDSNWNNYDEHLKKYSYCVKDNNGWINKWSCCQTPAYAMQTLATTMGGLDGLWNSIGSGWTFLTGDKLADRYDYGKAGLLSKATSIIDPHYMENYYLIQTVLERDSANIDAEFTKAAVAHEHSYTLLPYPGQEATCTEPGLGYKICECSQINSAWYDDVIKDVVIPATGHDWGEPTYVWAADNSSVTATHTCSNVASHVESETVDTTSDVTTPATCEGAGTTTYTAVFTNEAFETQTKAVEDVAPIGHDWGEPTYTWAADYSTCTATRTCIRNSEHIETETVNTTSEATTPATYTAEGVMTYTATFTNEAFATQTATATIPMLTPVFYLIGPDWTVDAIDTANGFLPNPNAEGEFMLNTMLAEGDEIKVVKLENDAITAWYPDGLDNQYHVDAAHAGPVTIYFKETYQNDWSAFGGYFYIAPRTPRFVTQNLILSGEIGVQFFVDVSMLSEAERQGCYMTFTIDDKAANDFAARNPQIAYENAKGDPDHRGFKCFVNAIQMADTITATLHYGDGQTIEKTYSVEQYIRNFEDNKAQYDNKTITLVEALCSYGYHVQQFLSAVNHWTLDTDYKAVYQSFNEAYDVNAVKTTAANNYRMTAETTGAFKAPGMSLVLDSETAIRIFLAHEDGSMLDAQNVDINVFAAEDVAWDAETQLVKTQKGNRVMVEIKGIKAAWLAETFTITAEEYDTDNTQTITVCALSYIDRLLGSEAYANNTAAQNAVCALYEYAMAAKAYND